MFNKPPTPPPVPGPNIPIIGEPVKLLAYVPSVLIQCQCEAKTPLMLVGLGAVGGCPHCNKHFTIASLQWQHGQPGIRVQIAQVLSNAPPAPSVN